ncbi:MAG: hypothetical protein HYS13_22135 [Planctomycetia bacterium]|nr:hypothetical protein [Planctomycetia bacterium]
MSSYRETMLRRPALIAKLVWQSPEQKLGRTALMKLMYILQVRGVPLGYWFRLYSYGPFDAEVLNDLDVAKSIRAVTERTVQYPTSYGFEIEPGAKFDKLEPALFEWLEPHEESITWALANFANRTAAELELLSTIVYVDRERGSNGRAEIDDLLPLVHGVKPQFNEDRIRQACRELQELRLLSCSA